MIFISHRGNLLGKNKEFENNPKYIVDTLEKGYDVEIDVWCVDGKWFLGHDFPQYLINENFLLNDRFWCHAKNLESFENLLKIGVVCFWHQNDDYTLTSNGFIWTYPGKKLTTRSICVLPENILNYKGISNCFGICSDRIVEYKERYD